MGPRTQHVPFCAHRTVTCPQENLHGGTQLPQVADGQDGAHPFLEGCGDGILLISNWIKNEDDHHRQREAHRSERQTEHYSRCHPRSSCEERTLGQLPTCRRRFISSGFVLLTQTSERRSRRLLFHSCCRAELWKVCFCFRHTRDRRHPPPATPVTTNQSLTTPKAGDKVRCFPG